MKVLMVASEANPLAKTGGLADVVYALSVQLLKDGTDVRIVMPYYATINNKLENEPIFVGEFNVVLGWRNQLCKIYETVIDGVTYYLLDNPQYFHRKNLYGFHDDNERFAFFTIAVKQLLKIVDFIPDVLHLHDWQAGMLPALIEYEKHFEKRFAAIKYVLTIHNPAFKGVFDPYFLGDYYGLGNEIFENGKARLNDAVSSLKCAIMYAHKITTVSPTHREELLYTSVSQGLEGALELRKDDFVGILNGIDYKEFDPSKDRLLEHNFNKTNFASKKTLNKVALLEKLNLKIDADAPLFGIVTRLTWQKGIDILVPGIRKILSSGGRVVVLGSGEYNYEQALEYLRSEYPSSLAIYIGYNDELAHQIYGASDFFLMPSLFEPCGISQMISLRYATLPIVRITGGLKDTVIPYMDGNLKVANGFGFYDYSAEALENTIAWAMDNYFNKESLAVLRKHALAANNEWKNSATKYLALYKSLI